MNWTEEKLNNEFVPLKTAYVMYVDYKTDRDGRPEKRGKRRFASRPAESFVITAVFLRNY